VVLVSCFGDRETGGGLFALDADGARRIDSLSSTGLDVADGELIRCLLGSWERHDPADVVAYDSRGVLRYVRVDAAHDAHDVLWHDDAYAIASTMTNSILWVSPGGAVQRRWVAPGDRDAWHLNSLVLADGELYASAFGRFATHRGWNAPGASAGAGIVFHVESGRDVVTGLDCPHDPRPLDGGWLVCDSKPGELVLAEGAARRRLALGGWTRGLAVSDEHLYVGVSPQRSAGQAPQPTAWVAVVDRASFTLVDRIALPVEEVFDVVLVDPALAEGAAAGFRTNSLRNSEQDQHALFATLGVEPVRLWAVSEPLPPEACRVEMGLQAPASASPGSTVRASCSARNLGGAILLSAPPHPVQLAVRWIDPVTGRNVGGEGVRLALHGSLVPGGEDQAQVEIPAPDRPGDYLLRATLVQEHVAWFDALDPGNAVDAAVQVLPG
jgi:acetolactate synthase-1/2/3 large subunit